MALFGNAELFDYLHWQVRSKKLAEYVKKTTVIKTGSDILPFRITTDGNKVIYEGGDAFNPCRTDDARYSPLESIYDLASDDEGICESYNRHYAYYAETERKQFVKMIMKLFAKVKNVFADDLTALNLDVLSEILLKHGVEITYNGGCDCDFDGDFPAYQWKIMNPCAFDLEEYGEYDVYAEETTGDFEKIKEHLQQFEGLHQLEDEDMNFNIEIQDNALIFTWLKDIYFSTVEEALEYFEEFPEGLYSPILETRYCSGYDCECFLNARAEIMGRILWSIHEAAKDFTDSPYENFDMDKIQEMLGDSKTVVVAYEYAAYDSE